jgi:all-trans-8'-apo-beta-carotenal 15,15'-oxygenase
MDRRRFLRALGLSAGALALAPSLPALALAGDESYGRFAAARAAQPWLAGWDSLEGDLARAAPTLEGKLPTGLRGTLFRNGPARFARAGVRYRHWFDGEGLVQAWRLGDGGVTHEARFVRTAKYERESAAGRFLVDGAGTRIDGADAIRNADDMNTANTSVLAHAGRLYALWEGGSAFELDPATLQTRGAKTWREDLAALPFSAHPLRDADGSVWNIGQLQFMDGGTLLLWRVAADGTLASITPLSVRHEGYAHSFVLGERHLVVVLAPWMLEPQDDRSFFESLQWRPERGSLALLIDKHDPTKVRRFELPAGLAYHWADGGERDGAFELSGCWYDDVRGIDAAMAARMRGERGAETLRSRFVRVRLPLGGGAPSLQDGGPRGVDFPDFRRAAPGLRRHVFALQEHGKTRADYLNTVVALDRVREREQRYVYGNEVLAEEHRFVPKPGATCEDDGWLVGTALDAKRGEHLLSVFDARDVAAGPLCQARLPRMLPLSFHAEFAAG